MDLATPRAATARVPWRPIVRRRAARACHRRRCSRCTPAASATSRPVRARRATASFPYAQDGDIYVGDPVTGATRLLVGGPENDYGPTFSPDGTQIGFVRGDAGHGEDIVIVASADGE